MRRAKPMYQKELYQGFKIAAGEQRGDFEGAVFQDTDVAKWLSSCIYLRFIRKMTVEGKSLPMRRST